MKYNKKLPILIAGILLLTTISNATAQVSTFPYKCDFSGGIEAGGWISTGTPKWSVGYDDDAYYYTKVIGSDESETIFETGPQSSYDGRYAYVNYENQSNTGESAIIAQDFDFSNLTNPVLSLQIYNYWTDESEGASLHICCTDINGRKYQITRQIEALNNKHDKKEWQQLNACLSDFAGINEVTISIEITPDARKLIPNIAIDNVVVQDFVVEGTVLNNVSCYDEKDGSFQLDVKGCGPTYIYSIDNSTTEETINESQKTYENLPQYEYYCIVKDQMLGDNCKASTTVKITEPPEIIVTPDITDINCYNETNGIIKIKVLESNDESYQPYTYSIDNGASGQSSNTFENLASGIYNVKVKNSGNSGKGCWSETKQVEIGENVKLIIDDIETTDVKKCYGDASGSINVLATFSNSNKPIYYTVESTSYTNTNNNGSGLFQKCPAGEYTVSIKDKNGCKITWPEKIVVNQPDKLETDGDGYTITDVEKCYGDKSGKIQFNVKGGTKPYYYYYDGISPETNSLVTGLPAGTYQLKAEDANGCKLLVAYEVTINQPEKLNVSKVTKKDVSTCYGDATGSISVEATGGTPDITYFLVNRNDANATAQQNSDGKFTNLTQGEYTVYIHDANECEARPYDDPIYKIEQPTQFYINTVTSNDEAIHCKGDENGIIIATVSGGTAPYYVSVNDFSTQEELENSSSYCYFNNLGAGKYTIVAKDSKNCNAVAGEFATINVELTEPELLTMSVDEITNVSCNAENDGAATLSGSGGVKDYSYGYRKHEEGNLSSEYFSLFTSEPTIKNLYSDTYDFCIKDRFGCMAYSTNHTISEPEILDAHAETTPVSTCYGDQTGRIDVLDVSGGTPPYQYSIDDGDTYQDEPIFQKLYGGKIYYVKVKDANGCIKDIGKEIVSQPNELFLNLSDKKDVMACNGTKNAYIKLTADGGTTPYKFYITGNDARTDGFFNNIGAGIYEAKVEDIHGCTKIREVEITQPDVMEFDGEPDITNNQCYDQMKGQAQIHVKGGKQIQAGFPYRFYLDKDPDNSNPDCYDGIFPALTAGTYHFIVRDEYNCQLDGSFTITQPDEFKITELKVLSGIECNGGNTGSIQATIQGGIEPITFEATAFNFNEKNNTTGIFENLYSRQYGVIATDGNECSTEEHFIEISEPDAITFTPELTSEIKCHDEGTAEITVKAQGGTGDLFVSLDNGQTYPYPIGKISNVAPGDYKILVTDSKGCKSKYHREVLVTNPPQLVLNANGYDLSCNTGNTGRIIAYATGGTKPYSFSIDNETWQETSGSFSNLTDGTYTVYLKDYNECSVQSDEITLNRPPNVAAFTVSETEGCTPLKVVLTQENKGTTNYDFSNGEVLYDRTGPAEYTFVNNTNSPQTYTITASMLLDNNAGCVDKAQRQVTVYPLPTADFRIDNEKVEWPTNTASFVNLSKNITEALWDFGDGTTSTNIDERTHKYEKCGNYNIVLVQSDGRCKATVERPFAIEGRPIQAILSADKTYGCEPVTVNFKNTSVNSDSCMWDFGDGTAPVYNSFNITHKYNAPGKFKAILTIYGDCGMQTSTAKDINVYTKPTAEFTRNLDTIYNGQTLKLECESSSNDHYIWDFGDGKSEEGSNKVDHLYSFDGSFNIKLVVTTNNNCSDTAKSAYPVVVISRPIVLFPNAFTPNGDGINDRFMPIHGDILSYKIEILNRLGVVVYVGENIDEGWDGTRHGKPCLPGMYVYKCKITLRDKSMYYQKGNIFLLR